MTNESKIKILSVAAAGALFAILGINNTLTAADYTVRSKKIKKPVNLVFLSDIHSQKFRDGGEKLLSMIKESNADCILFGGDIFDKYSSEKEIARTEELVGKIRELNENCYFVFGNHEVDCKREVDFKKILAEKDIKLFETDSYELTAASGQKILIGGADFIHYEEDGDEDEAAKAYKNEMIEHAERDGLFSVLLRHVPTKNKGDEKIDLILSGHNHGGLWRFPNTNAGVAGGGKNIFPRYVHGEYKNGSSVMIVGSGITTDTYLLPRIYNVPEVVRVILLPETNLPY